MKMLTVIFWLLFLTLSTATKTSVPNAATAKDGPTIKDIWALNAEFCSDIDQDVLLEKIEKVNDLTLELVSQGRLKDAVFSTALFNLYETVVDLTIAEILSFPEDDEVLQQFSLWVLYHFADLHLGFPVYQITESSITFESTPELSEYFLNRMPVNTLIKMSKLWYSRVDLFEEDAALLYVYYVAQQEIIRKLNTKQLKSLMAFFVGQAKCDRYMLPAVIFEINDEPCGKLTKELKIDTVSSLAKMLHDTITAAVNQSVVLPMNFLYVNSFLRSAVLSKDVGLVKLVYDIAMIMASAYLNRIDLDYLFDIVHLALHTLEGRIVYFILDLMFEPNFASRIASHQLDLSEQQVKTWEMSILFVTTVDLTILSSVLKALEPPYDVLFRKTAAELAPLRAIVKRATAPFQGKDFEAEISLLFDVYSLDLSEFPLMLSRKMLERIANASEVYAKAYHPLQAFARALLAFVMFKHSPVQSNDPKLIIEPILQVSNLKEDIPEHWRERFEEELLSEQVPAIMQIIIDQRLNVCKNDLGKCIGVFVKYALDLVPDVVYIAATLSSQPEDVLTVLNDYPDVYQIVLIRLSFDNIRLDLDKINCSSSVRQLTLLFASDQRSR